MDVAKLFSVAKTVKSPLTIAGMVVIVLYLLYKQILALDVFENIDSEHTFRILNAVLAYVFWLAVLSLVLGVICYALPMLGFNRRRSNLELVDGSNDKTLSKYDETKDAKGKSIIKPRAATKEQ